jgi:hypothetical protein
MTRRIDNLVTALGSTSSPSAPGTWTVGCEGLGGGLRAAVRLPKESSNESKIAFDQR